MKRLVNVFFVALVGLFVVSGSISDHGVSCSGDKHDDAEKKQSGGH